MYLWQYRFHAGKELMLKEVFQKAGAVRQSSALVAACQSGLYHNGGIHVFRCNFRIESGDCFCYRRDDVPGTEKDGYPDDVAGAIAAASGTLGVIIPPSIPMVVFGIAASVSVTDLFIGGVVPESCWL